MLDKKQTQQQHQMIETINNYFLKTVHHLRFTESIGEVNNTQADNANDPNFVISMYNLWNTVITMRKNQIAYSNIVEMNQMII